MIQSSSATLADTLYRTAEQLESATYRFAKTMPHRPHWYTIRRTWRGSEAFTKCATTIRTHGEPDWFQGRKYTELRLNGHAYCTMDALTPGQTTVINRKRARYENVYDEVAWGYDEQYSRDEHLAENAALMEIIKARLGGGSVLDIGCGTGLLLDYLAIEPERYTGIDPSMQMLLRCAAKHPGHARRLINCSAEHWFGPMVDLAVVGFGVGDLLAESVLARMDRIARQWIVLVQESDKPFEEEGAFSVSIAKRSKENRELLVSRGAKDVAQIGSFVVYVGELNAAERAPRLETRIISTPTPERPLELAVG